jgi:DNA-binding NarL/FixJ family response regulator
VALAEGPITLTVETPRPAPGTPSGQNTVATGPGASRDDRLVFAGVLTRRELDVLRLLAEGGTNRTIADSLVLSETTVKFHVNSILRKLHVANRAQAVARYLALLGGAWGEQAPVSSESEDS